MATSPEYDPSTYERSAAVYDIMNAARGKSYAEEVATLLRLVRERVGDAASLLDVSHFDFYWTVGRGPTLDATSDLGEFVPPDGDHDGEHDAVEQWTEPHRVALWSDAQYRDAFAAAGLDVEHDADGLIGRGLYLGHRPRD